MGLMKAGWGIWLFIRPADNKACSDTRDTDQQQNPGDRKRTPECIFKKGLGKIARKKEQ